MDEFAIKHGHLYATIFVEPNREEVLWVSRGRSREEIRPFFEKLGSQGRHRIEPLKRFARQLRKKIDAILSPLPIPSATQPARWQEQPDRPLRYSVWVT